MNGENLFGWSKPEVLNKNLIKVLDGIAGSAKSSSVDSFLTACGVFYGRYTSSHKLRRDAVARYGGHVQTIAGGLFETDDGRFFAADKPAAFPVVVLDEVLQTSPRVLEWCVAHVGAVSIIICTDSRQMLTPHGGEAMAAAFADFCKRPDVLYKELSYSYRPTDDKTHAAFDYCYRHALDPVPHTFRGWVDRHPITPADVLKEYDPRAAYICHSNAIETELYQRWGLSSRYDLDLIPKGKAAGRDGASVSKSIPILPQADVKPTVSSYYQVANLGSVTRYQGTEVQPDAPMYFICEPGARVSCREWYTALTRCKSLESLHVVYMEVYKPQELKTYAGKPIKDIAPALLDESMQLPDGRTLAQVIADNGGRVPYDIADTLRKGIADTQDTHFADDFFYIGGAYVGVGDKPDDKKGRKPVSLMGLLQREPTLEQRYMPDFWRRMESIRDSRGRVVDTIQCPTLIASEQKTPIQYGYACDLYSAYSHCLHFGAIPDGARLYPAENRGAEWVRFYYVHACLLLSPGCICTGVLYDYIRAAGYDIKAECIGSARKIDDCRLGEYLYTHIHTTKEDKAEIKALRYGFLSKPYLVPLDVSIMSGAAAAYAVDKPRVYELVMCAIKSELATIMLKIRAAVHDGDLTRGAVVVDCLYFDSPAWSYEIGDAIRAAIPGWDFRLHDPGDKDSKWYQTYKELPTREELRKQKAAARAKASRERKKLVRNTQ